MDQLIDLKALLVEREDCDAGTIQKLREGLAQGGSQFKTLKDVNETLRKRLESSPPAHSRISGADADPGRSRCHQRTLRPSRHRALAAPEPLR